MMPETNKVLLNPFHGLWILVTEIVLMCAAIWFVYRGETIEAMLTFILIEIRFTNWILRQKL